MSIQVYHFRIYLQGIVWITALKSTFSNRSSHGSSKIPVFCSWALVLLTAGNVCDVSTFQILLGPDGASKGPFLVLFACRAIGGSASFRIVNLFYLVLVEDAIVKVGKLNAVTIWEGLLELTILGASTRELKLRKQLMFIQLMHGWLKIIHQFLKLFLSISCLLLLGLFLWVLGLFVSLWLTARFNLILSIDATIWRWWPTVFECRHIERFGGQVCHTRVILLLKGYLASSFVNWNC